MKVIVGDSLAEMFVSSTIPEPDASVGEVLYNGATAYTKGARVAQTTTHRIYESLRGESRAVTITNATPAVVSWPAHSKSAGAAVSFSTSGGLPAGLTAGVTYYVVNPGDDVFQLATSVGGAPINTTTAGTGVHTAIISTNLGNTPETSPLHWVEVCPTNRWAALDGKIAHKAQALSTFTHVLAPGFADAVGLAGIEGATSAQLTLTVGAEVKFDVTYDLDATIIDDWYDYWWAGTHLRRSLTEFALPPYGGSQLTITLTGPDVPKLGAIVLGMQHDGGAFQWDHEVGLRDYSRVETDDWGEEEVVPGPFSRTINGTLQFPVTELEANRRLFEGLRGKAAMWSCTPGVDDLDEPLTVYGRYREWAARVQHRDIVNAKLELLGLAET